MSIAARKTVLRLALALAGVAAAGSQQDAWAVGVVKAEISPTPVSTSASPTLIIAINGSGVTDTTHGIASFSYQVDTAGSPQVKLNGVTYAGLTSSDSGKTFSFRFAKFETPGLRDETNQVAIEFKATGTTTFTALPDHANYTLFVDRVQPVAPSGVSALGADSSILVNWNAPAKSGTRVIEGYVISYSTTDFAGMTTEDALKASTKSVAGQGDAATSGVINGVENGQKYFITVRAVDWVGNVSDFPKDDAGKFTSAWAIPVHTMTLAELAGEKGGCFIATAAYGSYEEPHVQVLREFRDRLLLERPSGRAFVHWYYETSPRYATWIARHDLARALVRIALLPVIAAAYGALHPAWVLAFGLLLTGLALRMLRRPSGKEAAL